MRGVIQPASLRGERDVQAPSVPRMALAYDEPFFLQLIDDSRHRAETNIEAGRQLAHRQGSPGGELAQTVPLRHGQRSVGRIVETAELVQRRELVERLVESQKV